MEFTFDPVSHIYRLGGQKLPSPTGILADLKFVDDEWFTEEGCIRGQKVHKATAMLESPDGLKWESLKDIEEALGVPIEPYVRAWAKFLKDERWQSVSIEIPRYNLMYRFAGTPDRIGRFGDSTEIEGIEIKTCAYQGWHSYQTGFYGELPGPKGIKISKWTVVELKVNGDYSLNPITDLNAGQKALCFLTTWREGEKYGIYRNRKAD